VRVSFLRATIALASAGFAGCRASELSPTEVPHDEPPQLASAKSASSSDDLGCGIAVERPDGSVDLISIPARLLPPRARRSLNSRRALNGVPLFRLVNVPLGRDRQGLSRASTCAIQVDAPASTVNELTETLVGLSAIAAQVKVNRAEANSLGRDLSLEALFLPISAQRASFKLSPQNSKILNVGSDIQDQHSASGFASLSTGYPTYPVRIQGITVYGSGYFFDFRQLQSFMAAFWKFGADVQVQ